MNVIPYAPDWDMPDITGTLPWHSCGGKAYANIKFCPVHGKDTSMNIGYKYAEPAATPKPPPAPLKPLRIGDREREATAKHLAAAYTHGYLPVDIFQVRMDLAMAAEYAKDLPALTADLPTLRQIEPPEPKPEPVPVPVKRRHWWNRYRWGVTIVVNKRGNATWRAA